MTKREIELMEEISKLKSEIGLEKRMDTYSNAISEMSLVREMLQLNGFTKEESFRLLEVFIKEGSK